MQVLDHWLERPGARLRWRDEGTGPTLLLLHGWALDLSLFDPLVARLGDGVRCLRFDRRGYGESSGDPALETDVADAFALLDATATRHCAVLGMSQGARVAAALARRAPARVSHVVLDGAPALRGLAEEEHEPELPLEEYRRLAEHDLPGLRAALSGHPLLQLARPTDASRTLVEAIIARYRAVDLLSTVPAPPAPASAASLPSAFDQPVLVLNGAEDSQARLRIGMRLATVLPNACRVVLADAGHLACLDQPAAYADALCAFLRSEET
jgi:pimeloyl-ACP methyl ester carboxylesterase